MARQGKRGSLTGGPHVFRGSVRVLSSPRFGSRSSARASPREQPGSQRLLGHGPNVIREFCGIPKAWFRCGSSSTSQSRVMICRFVSD
jgi:hypothetical protein